MNRMPNFFIVGAARSGTTSLEQYFRSHPQIYIAPQKEMHFFTANQFPSRFKGPGDDHLNRKIVRDEAQYSQFFANAAGKKAIGEASAFYLSSPGTAEQIAQTVPNAKIIIILREPVARAYSAYMLLRRDNRETLGFAESLSLEEERKQKDFEPMWRYKELSLYYQQVKRYLDVFGTQQVKVLLYDELFSHPESVLRDVFTFLGVKADVVIDTSVRYNTGGVPNAPRLYTLLNTFINNQSPLGKRIKSLVPLQQRVMWGSKVLEKIVQPLPMASQMHAQTHAQLKAYFAEDVGNLEELLHRDLSGWQSASPVSRTKS
jgi:hypothetical protein